MHSGLLPSDHTPAIFPVEFISYGAAGIVRIVSWISGGYLFFSFFFFLAICLVLHLSRFCTVVGFCAFLGFFIPFYITGKAFVHLLPFYILYDVCVAICFSPTRLKDVGRLCHLFPLPWLLSSELFWSFDICFWFSYRLSVFSLSSICLYLYPEVVWSLFLLFSYCRMLFHFPLGSCISERFLMKFYDANYTEYSSLALQIQQIRFDPDWGILSLLFIPRHFPYLPLILSSCREWRV